METSFFTDLFIEYLKHVGAYEAIRDKTDKKVREESDLTSEDLKDYDADSIFASVICGLEAYEIDPRKWVQHLVKPDEYWAQINQGWQAEWDELMNAIKERDHEKFKEVGRRFGLEVQELSFKTTH